MTAPLTSTHVAQTGHWCDCCDRPIEPGDRYVRAMVPPHVPPNTDDQWRAMRWHEGDA